MPSFKVQRITCYYHIPTESAPIKITSLAFKLLSAIARLPKYPKAIVLGLVAVSYIQYQVRTEGAICSLGRRMILPFLWYRGSSPSCRLYPPACKPDGLEVEPEALGIGPSWRGLRSPPLISREKDSGLPPGTSEKAASPLKAW